MFNKYPINFVRSTECKSHPFSGYDQAWHQIQKKLNSENGNPPFLVVDGTHGVSFTRFIEKLKERCKRHSYSVTAVHTDQFLKAGEDLRAHFKQNISDNRAFGSVTTGSIEDYFVKSAQERTLGLLDKYRLRQLTEILVLYGSGAHWLSSGSTATRMFLDITRENQQLLYKQGVHNFGFDTNEDDLEKYKIALFVEWPIMEGYRKNALMEFDYYLDMNNADHPVGLPVHELQEAVNDISSHPIRVKPFFSPGVWGGQYLKKLADLPSDWVNCAWSFEPIAPENSLIIGMEDVLIEVPFLLVMNFAFLRILGERIVSLFGDIFPIRFNYLDTMDGSNLSCQVHPKQAYIREKFNYPLEQQESYYIMKKKDGSKVYLGLTESCIKESFLDEVQKSQETGEPINFTEYVQEWVCEEGDLFLIPTGTVHCSGKDNLVLEISATTWWFTFKIYDYVRKDLDGKPRPLNIDHAEANIDWYKTTNWVQEQLIPKPMLINQQNNNSEYVLGKRDDLLFYVNRIHLTDRWRDHTNGELMLINLVVGERVCIQSLDHPGLSLELGYAESFILPAVFGAFEIVNLGASCNLIKAGVSPEWQVVVKDE